MRAAPSPVRRYGEAHASKLARHALVMADNGRHEDEPREIVEWRTEIGPLFNHELGLYKTPMSGLINKGHSPSISRLAEIVQVYGYDLRLVGHGEVIHVKPNPKE